MFPIRKPRQRLSQKMIQSLSLTWDTIQLPTSPNWRSMKSPRILPMDDPKWILTWERVEKIIDYEFRNPEILREAMYPLQSGWARITGGSQNRMFQEGNKRLAHIGDSVLKTMAVDTWFWRMESASKLFSCYHERRTSTDGMIEELHNELQLFHTNEMMNGVAQEKGLSGVMRVWFRGGVIEGKKTEATTVEAVIGAVWFDSGNDLGEMRRLLDLLLGTDLVREHEEHCPRLQQAPGHRS